MTPRMQRLISGATALRISAVAVVAIGLVSTIPTALAQSNECLIDTYPPDGGVLHGSTIYIYFRHPTLPAKKCQLWGWSPNDEAQALALERVPAQDPGGATLAERYEGFIIGQVYEGTVRVNVTADQDYVSLVEFPLSFTVEEAGDLFDGSDLIVDRAETVVDEPLRRFVTTIEGRWPGPEVGHFVAFNPPVWSAAVAFPDPEDDGEFRIVYEQPMRPDDYRRDYALQGTLWAVNGDPENPATVLTLDLLEDVDLRHLRYDTCGCASSSGAAWPLAGLAAVFVRRRRARRSR